MNRFLSTACAIGLLLACTPQATPPQIVGADSDVHGCKGSAGYTWSVVRAQCLRVFESGVAFEPWRAPKEESVMTAFVVLALEEGAPSAAEAFIPGYSASVPLARVHALQDGQRRAILSNPAQGVTVWREQRTHVLEVKGKLYRHNGAQDDQLRTLH